MKERRMIVIKSINNKFYKNIVYILIFLLFLVGKNIYIFKYGYLWAEDINVFISPILKNGFSSIFDIYAGYLHIIPKTLTYIASLICSRLFNNHLNYMVYMLLLFVVLIYWYKIIFLF